jgi:hypothetical protein
VQSDLLDQGRDLGLSPAQQNGATPMPKSPRQSREVQHQRGVCEYQAAQIHGHVGLRAKGSHERPPAVPLGRLVFITAAAQCRWLFVEVDDRRNLPKAADP